MDNIKNQIKELESKLTGNMFQDMDLKEEIMALKRKVSMQEEPSCNISDNDCQECSMCGS